MNLSCISDYLPKSRFRKLALNIYGFFDRYFSKLFSREDWWFTSQSLHKKVISLTHELANTELYLEKFKKFKHLALIIFTCFNLTFLVKRLKTFSYTSILWKLLTTREFWGVLCFGAQYLAELASLLTFRRQDGSPNHPR